MCLLVGAITRPLDASHLLKAHLILRWAFFLLLKPQKGADTSERILEQLARLPDQQRKIERCPGLRITSSGHAKQYGAEQQE